MQRFLKKCIKNKVARRETLRQNVGAKKEGEMNDQQPQGLAPNVASLLCYLCLPVTSLIFLLIEKKDPDVRFHAWQATSLGVAFVILNIGLAIVSAVLGYLISILSVLVNVVSWLLWPAFIVLWVVCMIKAYQGERWRIPVIGDFAADRANV